MEGQTQKLGVFEAYSRGWKAFADNWKILVGLFLALFVFSGLVDMYGYQRGESYEVPAEVAASYEAGEIAEGDLRLESIRYRLSTIDSVNPNDPEDTVDITIPSEGSQIVSVLGVVVSFIFSVVLIAVAILAGRREPITLANIKEMVQAQTVLAYLVSSILVGLAVLAGLLLLIVPGIIFALMFSMTTYALVDKNRGPIDAMKRSKEITKGQRWQILGIAIIMIPLAIVATIPFGLGMLIVGPWFAQTMVAMYLHLEGESEITVQASSRDENEESSADPADVVEPNPNRP